MTLADAIRAELDRRQKTAQPRWPADEVADVFATLRSIVTAHDRGHLCAPRDAPHAMRLYGPKLPYGTSCPGLLHIAEELHIADEHTQTAT